MGDEFDWGWNLHKADFVEIINRESLVLPAVNLKGPLCGPITAALRAINLQNVLSHTKIDLEIEFGGSATFPNIRSVSFDFFAIDINNSATAKVSGDIELIRGLFGHWEVEIIVESDISR